MSTKYRNHLIAAGALGALEASTRPLSNFARPARHASLRLPHAAIGGTYARISHYYFSLAASADNMRSLAWNSLQPDYQRRG
jgi:hypothetical protein